MPAGVVSEGLNGNDNSGCTIFLAKRYSEILDQAFCCTLAKFTQQLAIAMDKWIGWDLEEKRANLQQVVNMSRFLIRTSVACQNLASRLLGMAVRKIPIDFEACYGYRPLLLESFVDTRHFTGTCYLASNWLWIGKTKGRGRQDRLKEKAETIKDIYVYPLVEDFRQKIGLPEDRGLSARDIASCIESQDWAQQEFGDAPLGDIRLARRPVEIGAGKAEKPGVSYANVVGGNWKKTKAF